MKIKMYLCGGELSSTRYPLGLGYLKSNCTADIEIVSKSSDLVDCDMIGLSTNSWGIQEAVEILEAAEVPVVLGGQGALWEPLRDLGFAHVVVGEGELAFQRILDGHADKVIEHLQVEDIDSLKFPARGHLDKMGDATALSIMTSRGCPFHCKFCSSNAFWKKTRFHSPEYFIEEIKSLLKMAPQLKRMSIIDDLFIAHRERFFKIAELWMQNGFHRRIELSGFVRSSIFDEEIAVAMKAMGFPRFRFGAETWSDRLLKEIGKGCTSEDHQKVVDIGCRLGVKVTASFIHGLPGETEEDKAITANYLKKNRGRIGVSGSYDFRAYPGTAFYDGASPLETDMRVRSSNK